MYSPTWNVEWLKNELGNEAQLLKSLPLDRLVTAPVRNDPLAISFRILLGYIKVKRSGGQSSVSSPSIVTPKPASHNIVRDEQTQQSLWIHLYPATEPNGKPEIQYHAYNSKDTHVGKHDGETICGIISTWEPAFSLHNRRTWSKNKLAALAKYYFFKKLADTDNATDRKKLRSGIPITKSMKDDLASVCREFAEDKSSSSTVQVTVSEKNDESSFLSRVSEDLSHEDNQASGAKSTVIRDDTMTPMEATTKIAREPTSPKPLPDLAILMVELDKDRTAIMNHIAKLQQQMRVLHAKVKAKKQKEAELKRSQDEIFSCMTVADAFYLGKLVERENTERYQRPV